MSSEAVVAAAVAGAPGAQGSERCGHRGHGQGVAERPRAASGVPEQESLQCCAGLPGAPHRGGGGRGGGEGGWLRGAGKETTGATTLSDLNNFQFQEGKRELEKYRRFGRETGKRRLRGPGSAAEHLWTPWRRREDTSGGGDLQRALNSPSEGQLWLGELGAQGL